MWKIAKKDLKIFFSDKKALALALLLPIGLITMFAFAFGGVGSDDEEDIPTPITVLFNDEDNSVTSKKILADLDSIPGIELISSTIADAQTAIKNGDNIAIIIFHNGMEDSLNAGKIIPAELQYDKSREMEISILQNLLMSKIAEIKGAKDADKGIELTVQTQFSNLPPAMQDSIKKNIQGGMQKESEEAKLITMTSLVGDEEANWGLIQAVAGTAIMMLLFSVSAIGQSMLEEKENGVLKKLLQSPIKPYEIMFGKMLTASIISVFQLTIMFLFSWVAFGLEIFNNIPALIIMILVTALACSSFGVLLSSIVTTKKQADSLGTIIILFMSAIGGSMIPLYIMPQFMQNAAVVSVNYWSIQGFYDIFWRKTGIHAIGENVIVLLAITITVLLVSNYFFKKNVLKLT
ncbi:MAG: ABC transporter permease [Fimbriimonadaceae bacterium]|nr:ABC transporter permease [Chitinophagales bacterium]